MIERLLNASRLALLRQRLEEQAANAPQHGLLSITLDLGLSGENWLPSKIARTDTLYWAQPESIDDGFGRTHGGDYRLALGHAMIFTTLGVARFSALQAAFRGLAPVWLHDDSQQTGVVAAAHLGFAFNDNDREELPNARLCVPSILLQNRAGRSTATFSCSVRDSHHALARWREELSSQTYKLSASGTPLKSAIRPGPDALNRQPAPLIDRAFLARAGAARHDIVRGKMQKVVLTRRVRFEAAHAIPVAPLLAALARRHPECTIYGIGQHDSASAFIGATPERLVALHNGVVRADALAGTAWLSDSSATPRAASASDSIAPQAGSLTLQGDKNSHEQQLVVDAVRAALAPLCATLDLPQAPEIMQVRELQHLRTRIAGRLRDGIDLFDLLAHLHPTPAVGGSPSATARQWLNAHGEQRGAWYTGGIGWIDRNGNGEVAVPLRCANVKGSQADLFAGSGIVAGSDPKQELAETEVKLGAMIDALQHAVRWNDAAADCERTGTK